MITLSNNRISTEEIRQSAYQSEAVDTLARIYLNPCNRKVIARSNEKKWDYLTAESVKREKNCKEEVERKFRRAGKEGMRTQRLEV